MEPREIAGILGAVVIGFGIYLYKSRDSSARRLYGVANLLVWTVAIWWGFFSGAENAIPRTLRDEPVGMVRDVAFLAIFIWIPTRLGLALTRRFRGKTTPSRTDWPSHQEWLREQKKVQP